MRERSWSCAIGEDLGRVGGRGYHDQNIPSEKVFLLIKRHENVEKHLLEVM